MKASALKYAVLSTVASIIILILCLIPFHAFLTVWLSSVFGHYTTFRLWKEALLGVCGLGTVYLIFVDRKIRTMTLSRRLVQLIIFYFAIQLVWGLIALKYHSVSLKALGYGWLIDNRFFLFFIIVWGVALRTTRLYANWHRLLLWPAVGVVVFGLLQIFVLPHAFLTHFGYGPKTISPYETINHNVHYIRIASTLRGANPLGAYLLIPISALAVLLVRGRQNIQTWLLFIGSLIVLVFSFSRGAWIGAVLSLVIAVVLGTTNERLRKATLYTCGAIILIGLVSFMVLHNNARFDNLVFHTQAHSASPQSSDQGHAAALRGGIHDLIHMPLGNGPGSAGPASIYNNHPGRIAENFYVQIGQEIGDIGMLVFIVINVGVGYLLWLGRKRTLSLTLFASLIGISLVNMLSHAWADDTLAYLWWGLAGIAIAALSHDASPEVKHPAGSIMSLNRRPVAKHD